MKCYIVSMFCICTSCLASMLTLSKFSMTKFPLTQVFFTNFDSVNGQKTWTKKTWTDYFPPNLDGNQPTRSILDQTWNNLDQENLDKVFDGTWILSIHTLWKPLS